MPALSVEELLLRYRERGDAGAFAELYDLTAAEVLRVAMCLTRNAAGAEDLVQATYLSAIESVAGWDAARPVMPWLLGILANRSRWQKRRESRTADAERIARPTESNPLTDAQDAELNQRLDDAVAQLGELYRPVLVLHLKHGFSAPEIALTLGRPPATIRTQLARGLELLKKSLPPGLALSALVLLTPTRGLAAIKEVVVAQASTAVTTATALIGSGVSAALVTSSSLAGALVMKKVVAGLVCAAVVGVAWFAWPEPAPDARTLPAEQSEIPSALRVTREAAATRPVSAVMREELHVSTEEAKHLGSLRCRVLWAEDRSPAVGVFAHVVVWGRSNAEANTIEIQTDARGELLLAELEPGPLGIYLDREGGESVKILPGQRTDTTLMIGRGTGVSVLVNDAEARPIANARVWLSDFANHTQGREIGRTDGAGRCFLRDVGEGRVVAVRATGFGPSPSRTIEGEPGERLEIAFVLSAPGGALTGLVRAPDGRPRAGAVVEITGFAPDVTRDGIWWPRPPFRLRTSSNGTFHADGLPLERVMLCVRAPGAGCWKQRVDIRAAGTHVEVPLIASARLRGVIHDQEGTALVGVRLSAGPLYDFAFCSTKSDSKGAYLLEDLTPGQVRVYAYHDDCVTTDRTMQLDPGGTAEWNLRLVRSSSTDQIRGRLVDEHDRPLVDWTVDSSPYEDAPQWRGFGRTDSDGRFVHKNCRAEDCRLQIYPAGAKVYLFPVFVQEHVRRGSGELLIRVPSSCLNRGAMRGVVTGSRGRPLPKAKVTVVESGRPFNQCNQCTYETDSDGRFLAEPLPPNEYELSVTGEGSPRMNLGKRSLARGEQIDLGVIALSGGGTLSVVLRGLTPDSQQYVYAELCKAEGSGKSALNFKSERGESELLVPGRYRLMLQATGYATMFRELEIRDGEVTKLELVPERGVRCTVKIVEPKAAKPWHRIEVWITDAQGREVLRHETHREDGNLQMPGMSVDLLLGKYRCGAKTDTGLEAVADLIVTSLETPPPPTLLELR